MIGLGEMWNGVLGSWRILRGDAQGMRRFDLSEEGFWRSFGLFVPLLLPVLVGIAAERRLRLATTGIESADFPTVLFLVTQIAGFAVVWYGFPFFLAAIAGPIGLGARFSPLIVARNWSTLLGVVPYAVSALLYAAGLLSPNVFGLLNLIAFLFNIGLGFQVARLAAAVPTGTAVGLVILDLLFTMLVANVAVRLVF